MMAELGCPLRNMASEAIPLVARLYQGVPTDTGYMDDNDRLDLLERQASFMQAASLTGALQQVGLATQCAERLDDATATDFERQSLRELQRHLVSLARFLAASGAELERTYAKALMPQAF